jgi:hypothetical protein
MGLSKKNVRSQLLFPKRESLHQTTAIFCDHFGVQLQDTLLLKNPEEGSHGIGLKPVRKIPDSVHRS